MKVLCRHGFFEYYPQAATDLKRFERLQRITLVPEKNYFTFEGLIGLDRFSLQGSLYKNLPALTTFEGRDAAEVMRENGWVYHLGTELLIPKELVLTTVILPLTMDCIVAPSCFVQPGAVLQNGSRLLSYEGTINLDTQRLYLYSTETSL
jgi:hypothetical protein